MGGPVIESKHLAIGLCIAAVVAVAVIYGAAIGIIALLG